MSVQRPFWAQLAECGSASFMRALFAVVLLMLSVPALCQESKADLSVGYDYQYNDQGNGFAHLHGWYGSATWNLSDRAGFTFETDHNWGTFQGQSLNQHTYLAGPSFKFNSKGTVQPVIQLLLGD